MKQTEYKIMYELGLDLKELLNSFFTLLRAFIHIHMGLLFEASGSGFKSKG